MTIRGSEEKWKKMWKIIRRKREKLSSRSEKGRDKLHVREKLDGM